MSRRRGGVLNISELPEELLVMILCRLPLRDAVATSSLSKRWQPLWSKLNKLNFQGTESCMDMIKPIEQSKFINQVNSVIYKYNQPIFEENGDHTPRIIEEFRIYFFLGSSYHEVIDKWLRFALSKKLKCLEFDLRGFLCYKFPLGLLQRNLLTMADLKELILTNVAFGDKFLEKVLTNCSRLEKIVIHDSPLLTHIRFVDGVQVGRNLQHFEIRRCWFLKTIYLSDFDLCSFTYEGEETDLRLTNLPKLVKIDMGDQTHVGLKICNNVFNQISSSLHTFSFKIYHPQENSKLNSLPEVPNVRNLRLNISGLKVNCLLQLASIVNACPNLETLTIQLVRDQALPFKNKKAKKCVAIRPLKHLKLIQILCYHAHFTDFEIVARVIKKCVGLKKIVVDPRLQSAKEVYEMLTSTDISNTEDDARSYAREYFGYLTPSGAELVVL